MKVVTFYADCDLPDKPKAKQEGFDWRGAIETLSDCADRFLGLETLTVTDAHTDIRCALRVGDARRDGVMLWLLDAQAAAIREFGDVLMVSPDTLIAGRLDCLFGDWDVCLLTRKKPKPIVNSVMFARMSAAGAWARLALDARRLPADAREWGADIDAVAHAFHVAPSEKALREVDGVRVKLLPVAGIFQTVAKGDRIIRPEAPIWDFKGFHKAKMTQYARLL